MRGEQLGRRTPGRPRAGRHRQRHARGAAAAARRSGTRRTSTMPPALSKPASRSTRWRSTTVTARRSIPQYVARQASRARRRRRGIHRRRRHTDGLGGALPDDERPAPADRLVQPRHDGVRAAAGDRRADRRTAGRQVVALSGDGGLRCCSAICSRCAEQSAGEGRRLQQLVARLRRTRDEGRRASSTSAPTCQPELRGCRDGDRASSARRVEQPGELARR